MTKSDLHGRANRIESSYEETRDTLRAHLESALGALSDGAPRAVARGFVLSAREILNHAEHGIPRLAHKAKDDVTYAYVPDKMPDA